MKIMLENVRLAFPSLFKATAVNDGEPRYSASFIMPPGHPSIAVIEKAMQAVAKEKWGKDAGAVFKALKAQDKLCLHDGDTKASYEGFEGNLFVSASAKPVKRPTLIDGRRNRLEESDGKLYAGCYVNAIIELWAQDNNWGKRINASLSGVQHVGDGDSFGGGASVAGEEEFPELSTEGEADPFGDDEDDLL